MVLAAAGGGAWLYRDRIAEYVPAELGGTRAKRDARVPADARWAALDDARPSGDDSGADPLAPLRRRDGVAYVTLDAQQAALALAPVMRVLPQSLVGASLMLDDDQLRVRGAIALRDLVGLANDGALTALLGATLDGRDTIEVAGPIEPARPGLVWWRVREMRVRGLPLPERLRIAVTTALQRSRMFSAVGSDADSLRAVAPQDALPVPLPSVVGDARVVGSRLTLYRAVRPSRSTTRPPR